MSGDTADSERGIGSIYGPRAVLTAIEKGRASSKIRRSSGRMSTGETAAGCHLLRGMRINKVLLIESLEEQKQKSLTSHMAASRKAHTIGLSWKSVLETHT